MARTKSLIVNLFAFVAVVVCFSCSDDAQNLMENGETPKSRIDYHRAVDSMHVDLLDSIGKVIIPNWPLSEAYGEVIPEATLYRDTVYPWNKVSNESLQRTILNMQEESKFSYNYGTNTIKTRMRPVYYGDREIPMWPGSVTLKATSLKIDENPRGGLYYAETTTTYGLYYNNVLLAEGIQRFIAEEGYKPSFHSMEWNAWHKGPASVAYANSVATVTCPDSLVAHEVWDDGSNRNWLRTTTTSKNIFSVTVGNTEVDNLSAVVGKTLTVNGDKASVADFTVTVPRTSKEIVEKSKSYTYNGKTINFIDSLHACGYKLYGGQVLSKTQVRIDLIREGATETVSFNLPVNLTEKAVPTGYVRVSDVHDKWNSTYATNNGFGITCNNHVVIRQAWSDNRTNGETYNLPYVSTNVWGVSGTTTFQVENLSSVLNVRYEIANGSASVAGNVINFAHSMSAEKVAKGDFSYQPNPCEAVARYITVTSSTTGRVDIYHENTKVGDYIVPLNITEKPHTPDYPGRTVWSGVVDAYIDGTNVATWESAQLISIAEHNGVYRLYHRNVNSNNWVDPNGVVVSAEYANSISNTRPAAMIGNTADAYTHGSCQWQDQGSWCKIVYFKANGEVARVISEISKTIGGESSNNCRKPLRGTWSNGKIVADGVTYKVSGSED